jgi:hypothetical protein
VFGIFVLRKCINISYRRELNKLNLVFYVGHVLQLLCSTFFNFASQTGLAPQILLYVHLFLVSLLTLIAKHTFCSRKKVDLRANFRCGAVLNNSIVNKPIVDLGTLETSVFGGAPMIELVN